MSLKSPLAFLVFFFLALLAAPLTGQDLKIAFATAPSLDLVRAQGGLVGLSVLVTDADGKPVEDGWANVSLDAPKPGVWFSSDIPLIEGTRLGEMRLPIAHGRAEWRYNWPIRGEYRLAVEATSADGRKANKTFIIAVTESAKKWLTLGGFALGLFLFGFVAGRIFTAPPGGAAGFMLALFLSGTGLGSDVGQISRATAQAAQATLTIEPAIVGKPSRIAWRLNRGGDTSRAAAMLTLAITQLEENQTVFAIEKLPVAGEFVMNFQFVDGSEHSVTAVAELPGHEPIRTEQRVSVAAVEPPPIASLRAIALFLFVIALGLWVGRWSKLRAATR